MDLSFLSSQTIQLALAVAGAIGYLLRHLDPLKLHGGKPKKAAGVIAAPAPAGTPAPAVSQGALVATLGVVKPPLQVTTAPGTAPGQIGVVTLTEPPHQVQVLPPA